jgi:hypothetical protein
MRLAGHVARMGKKRNALKIFAGKPEGNETNRKNWLWMGGQY